MLDKEINEAIENSEVLFNRKNIKANRIRVKLAR